MFPRVRSQHIVSEQTGDEVVIYDTGRHVAHRLNWMAAAVWRHADGTKSVEALVQAVRQDGWPDATPELVNSALDALSEVQLLVESPPADASRLNRRDALRRVASLGLPFVASIVVPTAQQERSKDSEGWPGEPTPVCNVTVSPTSASVPATGGSGTATVTTSSTACNWNATSNASWLRVSPGSGTGNQTVTWTADANPSTDRRTGTIEVRAVNGGAHTLTVDQAGKPYTDFSGKFTGATRQTQSMPSMCDPENIKAGYNLVADLLATPEGTGTLNRTLNYGPLSWQRDYPIQSWTRLPNGNVEIKSAQQRFTIGGKNYTGYLEALLSGTNLSNYEEDEKLDGACYVEYKGNATKQP